MHSEVATVLAEEHSFRRGCCHEGLMIQKDEITCAHVKSLMKEKEMYLRQRLCNSLPLGCYATSDNDIKKINLIMQPFKPTLSKENEKQQEDQKSEEATTEQQRIASKMSSSVKGKQINN